VGLEARGVVHVVGVESDAEEATVGGNCPVGKAAGRAAVARHLAVQQVDVEVGKLDVVALRSFRAPVQRHGQITLTRCKVKIQIWSEFTHKKCPQKIATTDRSRKTAHSVLIAITGQTCSYSQTDRYTCINVRIRAEVRTRKQRA